MTTELRPDMSEWVLHFVHDRNPKYEPHIEQLFGPEGKGLFMPAHFDPEVDKRFADFHERTQENSDLDADAHASQVLSKILDEGLLRSGWSFRNGKSTIYGPKSAVCFTEMPLSSLASYARARKKSDTVAPYAVGLLKSELYLAGGRPVTYGLSGEHEEVSTEPWPRFLSKDCGILESEQYRYVALNLGTPRKIDWTHEREWRWADHGNKLSVPGLPIWGRANEFIRFSRAIIVVQSNEESNEILSHIRRLVDARYDNLHNAYNLDVLKNTAVVSLEELETANLIGLQTGLTLEQIPHRFLNLISTPTPSAAAKQFARVVVGEALHAAANAAAEWRKGGDRDACGFAELVIGDELAEFTRAALDEDLLEPFSGVHPFVMAATGSKQYHPPARCRGLANARLPRKQRKTLFSGTFRNCRCISGQDGIEKSQGL